MFARLAMEACQQRALATRLWETCRREAMFSLYHPFVSSLVAGKLKLHSFQRFVAQDAFFLTTFVRTYGVAMRSTEDEIAKTAILKLQQDAQEELLLHSSFAKNWNLDLRGVTTPSPATAKYTSFLEDVSAGQGTVADRSKRAAFTIGAMVPCMRLYAFLGQQAQDAVCGDLQVHPYKDWISTYASPEFQESAARVEAVLERLSTRLAPADLNIVAHLYRRAMRLELDFFSAQPCEGGLSVPLLKTAGFEQRKVVIVSDFDSTCTASDSCPVLAELAINGDSEKSSRWASLSVNYFDDYKRLVDKIIASRDAAGSRYNYKDVEQALQELSDFEKQGNTKVIESQLLRGIKLPDIERAAHRMPLQVGCAEFFRRLREEKISVSCHILSVCWSQAFIEAALSKGNIKNMFSLHSNDLCSNALETDGRFSRLIETPTDKVRALLDTIVSRPKDGNNRRDEFVIYVGDSLTDLLCLLQADLGIVLGDSSSLRKVAEAFGVRIVPLFRCLVAKESSGCHSWTGEDVSRGTLYAASGWPEIEAFLLGVDQV